VAGCCECGDEPSGSGARGLVIVHIHVGSSHNPDNGGSRCV
jgi:hypothetical protein